MRLETFETEDAVYYLGFGNHLTSSAPIFRNIDFSELDLMVFEDGGIDLSREVRLHLQYADIYEKIQRENPSLPIYGVDVPGHSQIIIFLEILGALYAIDRSERIIKNKESRREFLKNTIGLVGSLSAVDLSTSFIEAVNTMTINNERISDAYKLRSNFAPTPIVGFRDAVTAKKISEYLVPKHKTDGRKPQVALLYGELHSGIETKLRHPEIADATIKAYRAIGYSSPEELNEVREVVRDEYGNSRIVRHNCGLFI